ncbi:MAG TPA: hypothetical protein VL137_12745 [Polyangiaceae bacterium]|jgi:hypothetical protein|nr:hypothetical protein [Polyangiaceae bacterium]
MLPCEVNFATPRKLPKARELAGNVAVLDIAFAGAVPANGFEQVTLPLITGLGERLVAWVDHHDHEMHSRYANDPRFVLCTKAEHGACPEMITPELVARLGPAQTLVCHTDFDGLVSAAKWMRQGSEPYPGCDKDAYAIDTRMGMPTATAQRIDRALRARPRDKGLFGMVVRHLYEGLADASLWQPIDEAGRELIPVEKETERAASAYLQMRPNVAIVDVSKDFARVDKTLLLLKGQERAQVSVVVDSESVSVAAAFDSGLNFLSLFGLAGGMPTRVSVPRPRLPQILKALGVSEDDAAQFT